MPDSWLQFFSAVLSGIVGFLFLRNPDAAGVLVMLMSVFFMMEGISKTVFALTIRPFPNWGWGLASGILGILIAFWLLANPGMSLLLGILIGIQLMAKGVALATMAWTARKEMRQRSYRAIGRSERFVRLVEVHIGGGMVSRGSSPCHLSAL